MNICFVSKTFSIIRGGLETYIYRTGNMLAAKGHNVHIVTASPDKKFCFDNLNKNVQIHEIDVQDPFRGSWLIDKYIPLLDIFYSRKVKRVLGEIVKKYRIDIVEFSDWLNEGLCYSFRKEVPFVVRLHGEPSLSAYYIQKTSKNSLRNRISWACQKIMLDKADAVTSCSQDYADRVSKFLNIRRDKISVIYNDIDNELFCPPTLAPKDEQPFILYAGRLERRKGVEVLYKVVPEILRDYPEIHFKFVGRDTLHPSGKITWSRYLRQQFDDSRITFMNEIPQEELVEYYQKSLICVFPSLYEMFGNVVAEAMLCGKPVIATNMGGFTEIIRDGKTGILVNPNDSQQLAIGIRRLLDDKALREDIGKNARATLKDRYESEMPIDATLMLYENAIGHFAAKRYAYARS